MSITPTSGSIKTWLRQDVLAFDIGIKNLAFCVLSPNGRVAALENCNILEEIPKVECYKCKSKASFQVTDLLSCKKHIPKTHTILKELGTKLPVNKVLKELIRANDCENLGATNDKCVESLAKKFAMPYAQPKQTNASKVALEEVHDSLRKFVKEKWPVFSGSKAVLLENQPVFKNPHMKSVQVLLFATLREAFLQHGETPEYHFIHAKKKTANTTEVKGDAGYANRKNQSEARLVELFESKAVKNEDIFTAWKEARKKSDMADALCMCVDYLAKDK
jgi:hypothetical protein